MNPYRGITAFSGVLVLTAALFFLLFPALIAPAFAKLFADFGGELPVLTRLAMKPIASIAVLLFLAGGSAGAVWRPRERAIILSLTAGGGLILVLAFVGAMYLPIVELAGSIE